MVARAATQPLARRRGASVTLVARTITAATTATSAVAISPRKKISCPAGSEALTNFTNASLTMKQPIASTISRMPWRLPGRSAAWLSVISFVQRNAGAKK